MLGVPGGGGRRTRGSCALGNDDTATLGALLRGHRERRGLSQEELAALVDPPLSVTTVGNLERGRTRPYRHTLEALCCALALTEDDRARLFAAWRGAVSVTAAPVALRALEAGRAAVSRRDWQAGFERLSAADAEGQLTAGDLEALGEAALWSGHPQESIDARQRAHAAYSRGGDRRGAARAALGLVVNNVIRLSPAVAAGWFQKAQRLLEGEPESVEHGLLAWTTAVVRLRSMDDLEGGLASARTAFEIGRRLGDEDVQAVALTAQGYALVRLGRRAEGLACLDEAMASAVAGSLSPFAAGYVYCWTLSTCVDLFDYRRALEWTDAIHQCAGAGGTAGYPGDCRVHKAAVLVVRSAWAEGEREALVACDECATFDLRHAAMATYAIGEIRLRGGDLAGAERAFRKSARARRLPPPRPGPAPPRPGRRAGRGRRNHGCPERGRLGPPRRREAPASAGRDRPSDGRPRDGQLGRGRAGRDRRNLREHRAAGRRGVRPRRRAARERRTGGRRPEPAAGDSTLAAGRRAVQHRAGAGAARPGVGRPRRPRHEHAGAGGGQIRVRPPRRRTRRPPRGRNRPRRHTGMGAPIAAGDSSVPQAGTGIRAVER